VEGRPQAAQRPDLARDPPAQCLLAGPQRVVERRRHIGFPESLGVEQEAGDRSVGPAESARHDLARHRCAKAR